MRGVPAWAGLCDGSSIRTLCNKLRDGVSPCTHKKDAKWAVPPKTKERIELPSSDKVVETMRLVCISAEGMVHKGRSVGTEVNCYHTVRLLTDGTVTKTYGPISTEAKGGTTHVESQGSSASEAKASYNKVIAAIKAKGFVEREA